MRMIWKKLSLLLIVFFAVVPVVGQVSLEVVDTEVDGYPVSIWVPVVLSSPTDEIGGIQFDLSLDPAWISMTGITSGGAGYSGDFTGDFNALDDATTRVVFYNSTNNNTIPTGTDTVMWLEYTGTSVLSAVIDMSISNIIISDGTGNVVTSSGSAGGIQIGEVASFSFTDGEADVLDTVSLDLNLTNDGPVGGFQLDVFDTPDNLDFLSATTTVRTDGFTVEYSEVASGTRILVYDPDNLDIAVGTGAVITVDFIIHYNAFEGYVGVNLTNVIATDGIGGEYWIASADSGTVHVTPGYIEEPHNLEAVSGLDGEIPLMWDAPYGPIPQDFGEDFEGGSIPDGWTATTNSAVGWFVTQDGSSTYWDIPPHTWYACSNDDAADDDGSVDYLVTPAINVSGAQNIMLNFESFFTGDYGQSAHIEISTDGSNFTEVTSLGASAEWVTESVDLSDYSGSPHLYIAFHSNDNGAWASGWAIDDISINFSGARIAQNLHYDFNELGQWVITADKAEVVAQYPNGIPYEWKIDWDNPLQHSNNVSRDLTGFNIYRSTNNVDYSVIETVAPDVTDYLDTDVNNSVDYYYYITSIYTPGGESGASNIVMATPLEWIELGISNGAALSGATDTLDIYLNNETSIGFFYFEISDIPNYFIGESILETDRTSGWSLDVVELPSGDMAITGFSPGTPLTVGDGSICKVVVRGFSEEEGTANVDFTTASIVDLANNEMPWTSTPGEFHVTIETQVLFFGHAVADPGTMITIPFVCSSTQDIYGIQVFLTDVPTGLTPINIVPSTYIDFSNWTVDFSVVGEELRIILFDVTLSNPIPPGTGQIAEINFLIDPGTAVGTTIELTPDFNNLVVSDVNSLPMHTEVVEGHVYAGSVEALFSFGNISGPDENGMVSYEVNVNNTVPVYVFDVNLYESPLNFTATNFIPTGRFANGSLDDNSGEQEDGSLHVLGYEFTSGITPGEGPILIIEGQLTGSFDVLTYFYAATAADVNIQPLLAWKVGYGLLPVSSVGVGEEATIPTDYALHQNYPNPFNPTTMITYDLAEQSAVTINIYDLTGRQVRTLVNDIQNAGQKVTLWDATDNFGRDVSAGVYIYQIKAGNFSQTRKMLYIK